MQHLSRSAARVRRGVAVLPRRSQNGASLVWTFESAKSIAETGAALETAFVGAYMGAVTALSDNELKKVAALAGANEAQHLTVFKQLAAGMLVPNPALPEVLSAAQATEAVQGFLA